MSLSTHTKLLVCLKRPNLRSVINDNHLEVIGLPQASSSLVTSSMVIPSPLTAKGDSKPRTRLGGTKRAHDDDEDVGSKQAPLVSNYSTLLIQFIHTRHTRLNAPNWSRYCVTSLFMLLSLICHYGAHV